MKVAFCTCVQIGLSCIEAIYDQGGEFDLFITLHDHKANKKSGRVYLNDIATEKNVPLLKISHINDDEVIEALEKHDISWLFIIGWSQIASKRVIESPHLGAIGAHPTLLPVGRGRAAIPWAILKGLNKTGVSFFKMDEGVDTGEILGQHEIPLDEKETATELYSKVNTAHIDLIKKIWPNIVDGSLKGVPQDESQATIWEGRKPEDGQIKPHMTVSEIDRLVRATTRPYPGAFIKKDGIHKIIWAGTFESEANGLEIQAADGVFIGTEVEVVN